MEQLLLFAKKAVKFRSIEAVSIYHNEVTVHTPNNRYTAYYANNEEAQKAYEEIIQKIENRG